MSQKVYVFGNEHLPEDRLALEVASLLGEFEVRHCRSPDDLLDAEGDILILDVVKGIRNPMVIESISQLKTRNMVSLHDFDVGYVLTLMNSLGISKKIKILGIPQKGESKKLAKEVLALVG